MRAWPEALQSAARPLAALATTAIALESVLSAATPNEPVRARLLEALTPAAISSLAHLLVLVGSVLLLALSPSLWRGTRRAWSLSLAVLLALAALNLIKGLDYEETLLDFALFSLLVLSRRSFVLGSTPRPRLIAGIGVVLVWASVYTVLLIGPLISTQAGAISRDLSGTVSLHSAAGILAEVFLLGALLFSAWFVRSMLAPTSAVDGHEPLDHETARELVRQFGRDSLSPFILREDKAFHFAAGGVLAYRVLGETAVVSGDPIAPPGSAPAVMESFVGMAHGHGWGVVLSGASDQFLPAYGRLGLRHLHIGNEAWVDPASLSLQGRRMRKVRQSVGRVQRRGWTIEAIDGRDISNSLAAEMGELESAWREQQRRIIGFAMSMGPWEAEQAPDDLYLLGRDPEQQLRGMLRFAAHPGGLSLDAMRRVGECPNGLNEALVVRALEIAGERGVGEVSLNFAGFAHLMAAEAAELEAHRRIARFALGLLGTRFQMDRLVRFNDKFQPEWRPRFLVYESRTRLPRVGLRVLQAEAYLRGPRAEALQRRWRPAPRPTSGAS